MTSAASVAAEQVARTSYGRLVAILSSTTRDIAAAEDALADAFAAALATWPVRGVPENPDAWLLTAARRNELHRHRHRDVQARAMADLIRAADDRGLLVTAPGDLPDRRLELLFVCAHPAIDEAVRTPLMLQAVLGLDAARIASAFLVAPATMSQRLVRAKTKIRAAGIQFEVPVAAERAERLKEVLQAIYVAFGAGWEDHDGGTELTEEALFLGRLVVSLLPDEPEALGLLSLMQFCHSRRHARHDAAGRFVPLGAQDSSLWERAEIIEAERLLVRAAGFSTFGRFQCEAAIQSVHAQRAITGTLQHAALHALYDLLLSREPSIGVAVGRAAARLESGDLDEAERSLEALGRDADAYQPYWVTRARLAELRGQRVEAIANLTRAIGLTETLPTRRFLEDRRAALDQARRA